MSVGIQELTNDEVVLITNLLTRRPEHGIGIPSKRWLERQEEKMKHLPKKLLRSSNLFKRIAAKVADRVDPHIVDPRAILCKTHSHLNPFLIRRLFVSLAYEITVHTDSLRSWPGKTSAPELSALIGRLNSIAALWTEPLLFHEIYGTAPFDSHLVYVKSACEACCLAAVGASGRALADIRAGLMDRMERRRAARSRHKPRLLRVIEAWIDHLQKHHEGSGRSQECRTASAALLDKLRIFRPQIEEWRAKQHSILRTAKHSRYTELRRTKTGSKITPVPANAEYKRRTRDGIPVVLANDTKQSANRAESISISEQQRVARDLPSGPHHPTPECAHESGAGNGLPNQPFIDQFQKNMSIPSNEQDEERDLEEEERSRIKVQNWWANILHESQLDVSQDEAKSVMSMVHPAFRPGSIAESAIPNPLEVKKGFGLSTRTSENHKPTASVWTDCTVYTTNSSGNPENTPPVPKIPSMYKGYKGSQGASNEASSRPTINPSSASKKDTDTVLNWPAPTLGRSDESTFSMQRHTFLKERFQPKAERDGGSVPHHSDGSHDRTPAQAPVSPTQHPRPSSSVYDSDSISSSSEAFDNGAIPHPTTVEDGRRRLSASASSVTQLEGFKGRM